MSELVIEAVDVHDAAAYRPWYDVYAAAERHGREAYATVWQAEELRVALTEPSSRSRQLAHLGTVDGRPVVAGWIEFPLLDNLDRAKLSVHVAPEARRRGHGTTMLVHLEELARAHGRNVLGGEATYSYASGPDGLGESGPEFARARGYDLALGDVQRRLALPVADDMLERLAVEAAPHHTAYTLRSWVGPVPDDLVHGWVALSSSLSTEAPVGGLDLEPEAADIGAHRESEQRAARQGRTKYNTVALCEDGEVVAYTDIATTIHEPGRAYQWGTLVRRDHRGHRLGLAVKVANLRLLQAERPDIDHVITYNAEVNGHMIGVNERLGFVPSARLAAFQKRV